MLAEIIDDQLFPSNCNYSKKPFFFKIAWFLIYFELLLKNVLHSELDHSNYRSSIYSGLGRFFKVSKHNTKYEWWSGTEGGFGEVYIKHTYINMTCLLLTYSIQSKAKMEHYSKPFLIYSYKNEKSCSFNEMMIFLHQCSGQFSIENYIIRIQTKG